MQSTITLHSAEDNAGMNGPLPWPRETVNYAVKELCREFPTIPPARIFQVVDAAARELDPAFGGVALLRRARMRL